jgi:hypothetical protein
MRSIVPMDHVELVFNGEVIRTLEPDGTRTAADFEDTISVSRGGWLLLRAWNDDAHPDVFDLWPYGTTNPVFLRLENESTRCGEDADYFLRWIDRVREATLANEHYNDESERKEVLAHIDAARAVFLERR